MSDADAGPVPYRVSYTVRVRERLAALAETARHRGDAPAYIAALQEFDRRLHIYPQFGEPLYDLTRTPGQVWIGILLPLSMKYIIFDEPREVTIAALPVLLPKRTSS